ncbi:MAG TPA: hypothetical protein PLR44_12200 [Thermomicrobiales bacterium]|nr:hypothetical protein [Thermomicrobiales bacterium]
MAARRLHLRLSATTLRPTLEVALAGTTVVLSNEVAEAYDRLLCAPTGPSPAMVNAVLDALTPAGITYLDMPLSAPKVWAALQAGGHACRAETLDR